MKIKIYVFGLIINFLFSCQLLDSGFELKNELMPVRSGLTHSTPEYHLILRKFLLEGQFDGEDKNTEILFLKLASFEPEIALGIFKKDKRFYIKTVIPKKQIWYLLDDSKDKNFDVELQTRTKIIPDDIAIDLNYLWESMLLKTSYPKKNNNDEVTITADGVGYVFIKWIFGLGDLEGGANDPPEGTKPYFLAEIGESLIKFISDDKNSTRLLRKQINNLKKIINQQISEKGSSLVITSYSAAYQEGDRYTPEGIRHALEYKNVSD